MPTGLGLDIDADLIKKADQQIQAAGEQVASRVKVFKANLNSEEAAQLLRQATVVFLFLLPTCQEHVQQMLLSNCAASSPAASKPAVRIVTSCFSLRGWKPDKVEKHAYLNSVTNLYLYTFPPNLEEAKIETFSHATETAQ